MATEPAQPRAVPRHVAIIMDGNGRWAAARGAGRAEGHRQGVEAVRRTARAARDLGVQHLTLFGFSTENWKRPAAEVDALFALLRLYVSADLDRLAAENVRIRILGSRQGLPADLARIIDRVEARTAANDGHFLNIAFNYGGRDEIVRAAAALARDAAAGLIDPDAIDCEAFAQRLDTHGLPDPDLLIRTSGEMRISNFLLWQLAYAELVFLDVLWPEFGETHLAEAIDIYRSRNRRFGGLSRSDAA
jgi:undecaprenyl diphosphate synthase